MKKIGIITLYYNNFNYGGLLQAYSLCRYINNLSPDKYYAEQISYDASIPSEQVIPIESRSEKIKHLSAEKIINKLKKKLGRFAHYSSSSKIQEKLSQRNMSMSRFQNNEITHSKTIYNSSNISSSNKSYDCFITGSDQVWNPMISSRQPAYFLTFVQENKRRASYAASIAAPLSPEQNKAIANLVSNFDALSLREYYELDGLQNSVKVVVDPTILLTEEEWTSFCKPYPVDGKYVLCYFLGDDKRLRSVAAEISKKYSLPILTFPHILGQYRKCDDNFGDHQLYDVAPDEFVYLLKNAEYILTDSFHAAVFSNIFKKKYLIFNRRGTGEMSSRIRNLIDIFGQEYRYIRDVHRPLEEICLALSSDVAVSEKKYIIDQSKEFINDFLLLDC